MAMHSLTEWMASIPDELTLRDALVYVNQALDDAKEATASVVNKYQGGTLPPPPWPQHEALASAVAQLEGGVKLINIGIDQGRGDDKFKKTDVRAMPLLNAGRNVYREIDVMLKRDKRGEVTLPNLPGQGVSLLKRAAEHPLAGLAIFAGALYLWNKYGRD